MTTFEADQTFSMLIHADSKVGKSTLTATAPKPILVLDVEGSWRFIPLRQVAWDPIVGPPPTHDGTWDACVVTVREWDTLKRTYEWLAQYQTPFATVVIDSISEVQRRLKQNLKGTEPMKIQDWGVLLTIMDATIRGFRDLVMIPGLNVRCVVFVAETREANGRWAPYMQGQISIALPYWMDVVGYLYPDHEMDANGQPTTEVRRLLISPHPQYITGERVQGRLGSIITIEKPAPGTVGNDIERMMTTIYSNHQEGA